VRDELLEWVTTYPRQPAHRDATFAKAPVAELVKRGIPRAIQSAVPDLDCIVLKGSAGKGTWAHTPWVALLDQRITTTVEEGYYVVYLLSLGAERLYLTIAQGCTELMKGTGERAAREELRRRAGRMQTRIGRNAKRLRPIGMDLSANYWRARLYEAGAVVGIEYDTKSLPQEGDLVADLVEALHLYRFIYLSGGEGADDEIMTEARDERGAQTLEQAKRYRQHRAVERQTSHSRKVKRLLGTRCMGCGVELGERYGPDAAGVIDAHHLIPLDSLADGAVVQFDPETDFAVLCPNCHRVIHRLDDPSDLDRLREMVRPYRVAE
jgi:5-methylcytosine-specific restriction protein A